MSEINPFEAPPLVEYENCITHDEIVDTLTSHIKIRQHLPKWRWLLRWKLNLTIGILASLDYYIHQKQERYGGTHEEIN